PAIARRLTECVNIGVCAYVGRKRNWYVESEVRKWRSTAVQCASPTRLIDPMALVRPDAGEKPPEYVLLTQRRGATRVYGPFWTAGALHNNAWHLMTEQGYTPDQFLMIIRQYTAEGGWGYTVRALRQAMGGAGTRTFSRAEITD
ncbi:hypothetical protein LCGC14_2366220, partial [marine sediment metagenome]